MKEIKRTYLFTLFFLFSLNLFSQYSSCRHFEPFTHITNLSIENAKIKISKSTFTIFYKYTGREGNKHFFRPNYKVDSGPYYFVCETDNSSKIVSVKVYYHVSERHDAIRSYTNRGWTHFANTSRLVCEGLGKQINYWNIGDSFIIEITDFNPPKNSDGSLKSERVFVCDGDYARKFHSKRTCYGLNNCRSTISFINTFQLALKRGFRFCDICWN